MKFKIGDRVAIYGSTYPVDITEQNTKLVHYNRDIGVIKYINHDKSLQVLVQRNRWFEKTYPKQLLRWANPKQCRKIKSPKIVYIRENSYKNCNWKKGVRAHLKKNNNHVDWVKFIEVKE